MNLNYVEVLRDVGPHFLCKPYADSRVLQTAYGKWTYIPLNFNYMIMQSYDF